MDRKRIISTAIGAILPTVCLFVVFGMLYAIHGAIYQQGFLDGKSAGWSDCSTPIADMKRGVTRCPGSDLPNVKLELK